MLDLRREDGIALIVVLGVMLVFTITTVTAVNMATSANQTQQLTQGSQTAITNAETGVNDAESMLYYQNTSSGNPASPTLFGCGTGSLGASDCTTYTPLSFCVTSGCTAGKAGSAKLYGYFSGTNAGSYNGISVPPSTWLLISTGYAAGPGGTTVSRTLKATVKISALGNGGVASVWNHIFITSPLVAGQCQIDFSSSNGLTINVPIYAIGNVCLGTNSVAQPDATHPVDIMVGGALSIAGGTVGTSASPIYSGVAALGCTTGAIGSTTSTCSSATNFYAGKTDTFIPQDAPGESASDIKSDYSNFDPGPKHPCASGTTPAAPTGGTTGSMFDSTISSGEGSTSSPDTSGSVSNGTSFELAPTGSSYACISTSGTSTGYLIWNGTASSFSVSGITVPPSTLAINGSVFFDSNVTISSSFTYQGTGVIESAGTFTINNNATYICAVYDASAGGCSTSWQGNSGNTQMLTLASVSSATPSFTFSKNNESFQGSMYTQPTSAVTFKFNGDKVMGPMSIGKLDTSLNNATFAPLPVIKNMPAGAPIPPNTSVNISAPSYLN